MAWPSWREDRADFAVPNGVVFAALAGMVTGTILAPQETQRRVVSGKTGRCSSSRTGKSVYVSVDPGGEMVAPIFGGKPTGPDAD